MPGASRCRAPGTNRRAGARCLALRSLSSFPIGWPVYGGRAGSDDGAGWDCGVAVGAGLAGDGGRDCGAGGDLAQWGVVPADEVKPGVAHRDDRRALAVCERRPATVVAGGSTMTDMKQWIVTFWVPVAAVLVAVAVFTWMVARRTP